MAIFAAQLFAGAAAHDLAFFFDGHAVGSLLKHSLHGRQLPCQDLQSPMGTDIDEDCRATLLHMLIILLIVLLLVFGGGGYYMGPGLGYYGGGAIDLILVIVILYLIFGRGRTRI